MLKKFLRDHRGNFAVMTAIMMTSLVGVAGLVTDYGNGLFNRLKDQRMADVAALAGGTVYASTNSTTSMTAAVSHMATLNGYASGNVTATLVNSPSGDGNQAVQVVVNSTVPLSLAKIITGQTSISVSGTSYAELSSGSGAGCMLALDKTASKAITLSGSANLQAPKCDVIANSNNSDALDMSGSAKLSAACTITVGGQNTTSGLTLNVCTKPTTGASATTDPYAALPAPTSIETQQCLNSPTSYPAQISYGYYCKGLSVNGTVSFQPGIYYIKGNLALQGSTIATMSGTGGATFFIDKSGTTAISGSATVNLNATTTGTYAGVLFFGDRAGTTANNNNISGSTSSLLVGTIYYPTQNVTFSGGSNTPAACLEVIGDKITISGTAYLGDSCAGTGVASINPAGGSTTVALVQ